MPRSQPKFFGHDVKKLFVGSDVRSFTFAHLPENSFAATHVTQSDRSADLLGPVAQEKSFLVEVQLKPSESTGWGIWMAGMFESAPSYEAGAVGFYDLELEPRFQRDTPFDSLLLNIPKSTLEAHLDSSRLPSILGLRTCKGTGDSTMLHLARLMVSYVDDQIVPSDMFLEHYIQMVCGHVVLEYGYLGAPPRIARGGLAPWQRRRTLEILEVDLEGDLSLARLSSECGLSSSYFCRSFKATFGDSVHQFVVKKRVERAQQLLLQHDLSIAEVSIRTGFSDQAAFSRTFTATVGNSPGKWRNEQRSLKLTTYQLGKPSYDENTKASTSSVPSYRHPAEDRSIQLSKFDRALPLSSPIAAMTAS